MTASGPVAHYLERYAEPIAGRVDAVPGRWRRALVVPLLAESPAFWAGLRPHLRGRDVLTILVVNETVDAPAATRAANAELLAAFGGPGLVQRDGEAVFVVDATASGTALPLRQGVGLARKLGFDLALALWADGRLHDPWIHGTDADARPPGEAFVVDAADASALALPFVHEPCGDPRIDAATEIYDLFLRYYVAGLAFAGSPWAHPSLGSALAVRAQAYAAVRGMPRRTAGEDFYLLAKLAKIGRVLVPDVPPVRIRARSSTRVPFGTGPAVAKIARALDRDDVPRFHDPQVFVALRDILAAVAAGVEPDAPAWRRLGGPKGIAGATRSARTPEQRRRRVEEWLDAFRTLKLVHALEADGHPRIPWRDALATAPFPAPRLR